MKIKFIEIQEALLNIIRRADGRFLTAYQICKEIEKAYPAVWGRLTENYRTSATNPIGAGAGAQYSPASFVANALKFYIENGEQRLIQESLISTNVIFDGVEPGWTGNWVGIWAWRA